MRRMRHLKPWEIQGCQLSLDASIPGSLFDATTGGSLVAANGAVARWEDQSGNGNHVIQGTGANQPLRRVSIKNGLDALEFNGTSTYLQNTGLTTATPITVMAFASGNADNTAAILDSSNTSTQVYLGANVSWEAIKTGGTRGSITIDYVWGGLVGTYTTAGASLQRGRAFDSALGGGATSYSGLNIGVVRNFNTGYFWNGHIAEVAVFNQELSRAVRQRLNDSRSRKWRTDR